MSERTLVLVKPDGVKRGLVGEVISRIERKGLRLAAMDLRMVERSVAEEHYAEHKDKPFYGDLLDFITSGPATPGTIRGDFALETQYNLVHGSDSPESAERELKLWFPDL